MPDIRKTLARCGRSLWRYPIDIVRWHIDAWFDRCHGIDTSGKLSLAALKISSPHVSEATWYEPVPTVGFRRLMRSLDIEHDQYVFIDYGSGKGRALFLAADYPFKEVIGLEFSGELHETAERNIQRYRSPRQRARVLRSVCIDAVDFELPPVKSVLFFYSPFKASIFEKILCNVRRSLTEHPRSLYLVFIGFLPESVRVLKASGFECREVPLGTDYIRWERKTGLILHSGGPAGPVSGTS
jgi:SAM-dependent methyltransferase